MNRILKAMLKLAVPITGLVVFTSCVASFYRDNSPENTFRIDNRTEYELVFQSRWSPETVCPAGENTLLANGQAEDRFTVLGNYHRLVVRSGEGEETFMFDELMNAPLRRYYLEESNWEMEAEGLTGDDSGEEFPYGTWTLVLEQEEFDAVLEATRQYYKDKLLEKWEDCQ